MKKEYFLKSVIIFLISVCVSKTANADLGNEMNKFWNNLGGSSNSNSAYADQSIGYYTGGSINTRAPVIQQRPVNIQAPKITAGCGGIDMFTGSFSHINLDQFVAQMKAIGANAVGYAFQIGLETLSPMIASTMSKLQETVDMINSININSCESAKLLVDGVAGRGITAKESMCAQMALIRGSASDADAAKSRCKSISAQVQEDNQQPDSKKLVNINLTWQAMKRDGYVESLGVETSEAFMSLIGTIIYKENEEPRFIIPLAFNEDYTKALINGGKTKIKECDETAKCLILNDKEITISNNMAYKPRIKSLLQSMQDKIKDTANGGNQSLSDSELALINQTSLPILRIMVNTATGSSPIRIDMLSEVIARDMLNKFTQNIVSSLRLNILSLKTENNHEQSISIITENIDQITEYLKNNKEDIDNELKRILDIINTNEQVDRKLASQFSGNIKSVLDFSNNLSIVGK